MLALLDGENNLKLSFVPKQLHVIVEESGEIDFLALYRSIRECEGSSEGIAFPENYGPGGFQEISGYPKKVESAEHAKKDDVAANLWDVSEKMTGVFYF